LELLTLQSFDPATAPRGRRLYLFAAAALSSTILLKIAQIQYLELINLGMIGTLMVAFARNGYQATWFRPYLRIASLYAGFILVALALGVAALRFHFYLSEDMTLLKSPVFITISRAVELTGNLAMMLYIANTFRQNEYWLRFTMRVYFWVGIASTVYSAISYPLKLAGIASLGTYSESNRFRGFYNEGGPYGLYVVSLMLVGIGLHRKRWESGPKLWGAFGLLFISLVMAQSKAAYAAILFMGVLNVFLAGSFSRRMVMLAAGAVVAISIYELTPVKDAVLIYHKGNEAYERYSHLRSKDPDIVYGRVAGAFIVPRMIAAHPLTGIGWGNYGNLRNDPEYRGASVFVEGADDPGLGLLGSAADLGLPLTAFLVICLFVPFFYARHRRAPLYVVNLVLWQPVVHIFGGQLNLTYPWIVTALALGLIYAGTANVNAGQGKLPRADVDAPSLSGSGDGT